MSLCLLCKGNTVDNGKQSYRRHTDWVRCVKCGFSQVEPMPTEEELIDVYASGDYRQFTGVCLDKERRDDMDAWAPYHPHDEDGTMWGSAHWQGEYLRIEHWFKLFDSRAKSYLDVGASTGRSVQEMKKRGLEISHGVEPGRWGREWGAFETLVEANPKYDIVTCLHVLEHVPDPVGLFHDLIDRTNIQLCLEVPIQHKRIWPHVGDFTEDSFRDMVIREGYQPRIYVEGIYLRCAIDVS